MARPIKLVGRRLVSISVDDKMFKLLKTRAHQQETTMSDYVRKMLEEKLR